MGQKLDLLLKGGHVIDPANDLDGKYDVGIKHGRIARVDSFIDVTEADKSIDVENLVVSPGLIDMHVHAYHTRIHKEGNTVGSLNADAHFLKEGVTTCVDTGTAGADGAKGDTGPQGPQGPDAERLWKKTQSGDYISIFPRDRGEDLGITMLTGHDLASMALKHERCIEKVDFPLLNQKYWEELSDVR